MKLKISKDDDAAFTWSDAWVFTSLYMTTKSDTPFDLSKLIGCCDMLNHSIVTAEEINLAFVKFRTFGLVSYDNLAVIYSEAAQSLIEKIERKRGGLFSRVDLTLSTLNSKRIGLAATFDAKKTVFFSEEETKNAYNKYSNRS